MCIYAICNRNIVSLRGSKCKFVILLQRRQKHFISMDKYDKKVLLFPNTAKDSICVPKGYNVCRSIESFKIKTLKGGFQRRPELIANNSDNYNFKLKSSQDNKNSFSYDPFEFNHNDIRRMTSESSVCRKCPGVHPTSKTMRIQLELSEMALQLRESFLPELQVSTSSYKSKGVEENLEMETIHALDIGCGNGISMVPLLNRYIACTGLDLNVQTLMHLKQMDFNSDSNSRWPSVSMFDFKDWHSSWIFDVVQWDIRHGLPFKDNMFDLAVSISFFQWLFYGYRPHHQLTLFFSSLQRVLRPGGQCIIQFYPQNPRQLTDAINYASTQFHGAVVGDYPHIDRGRKIFILLFKTGT